MSITKPLLDGHPDVLYSSIPQETLFGRLRRILYDAWCYATFSHASHILDKGKNKDIDIHSAVDTHPVDTQPSKLLARFQSIYPSIDDDSSLDASQQSKTSQGSARPNAWRLLRVLGILEWKGLLTNLLLISIKIVSKWGGVFMLREFLIWIQDYNEDEPNLSEGWIWGVLLTLSGIINSIGHHRAFWTMQLVGYRMRTTLMSAIYAKLMRINHATMSQITAGHVVNLVSNDMRRFDVVVSFPYLLFGPLEVIFVCIIISRYFGVVPTFSGMSVLILFVPLQGVLSRYISKYREQTARVTDRRISATGEVITGMLAVKMLGWEDVLSNRINNIRKEEHRLLVIQSCIHAANSALPEMAVHIIPCIIFITCRLMNIAFDMPDVFFVLSMIIVTTISLSYWFAESVRVMSELYITCKRVDAFLQMPELTSTDPHSSVTRGTVEINNGSYGWPGRHHQQSRLSDPVNLSTGHVERSNGQQGIPIKRTLSDINFIIQPGELIGIAGSVGSGKSCLFSALLNDMKNMSSEQSIRISGKVSFCSQMPWIMAGSVRENITFGQSFDPVFYGDVIDGCALSIDLEQLPKGDATELGERGINISGGQKARLALARAAYSRADVHLLDDPLSAVDARVGRLLFNRCIGPNGLMQNSTRLLITHQLQYLPFCDRVFLMKDGKIEAMGKWNDLLNHDIIKAIQHDHKSTEVNLDAVRKIVPDRFNTKDMQTLSNEERQGSHEDQSMNVPEDDSKSHKIDLFLYDTDGTGDFEDGRLVIEESKEIGQVAWNVYSKYFQNLGIGLLLFGISMVVMASSLFYFSQWWIASWTGADPDDRRDMRWVWTLVILAATSSCLSLIGISTIFLLTVRASTRIHGQMLQRVVRAPLKFFHTNPTGRILNRFAKDLGIQDEDLQIYIDDFTWSALEMMGGLVLMAMAMPYVLVFIVFIGWIFARVRRRYVSASREIKRFDGITRSSVYALLSDSIKGLSTIRAYGREDDFQSQFQEFVDMNGTWRTAYLLTARWLGFRLDIMNVSVMAVAYFLSVLLIKQVAPELLGLALTFAISLTGSTQVMIRTLADLENSMTSVERVLDYTRLDQEPPRAKDGGGYAPEGWPYRGDIIYESITASYRPGLEPVLQNLSFSIPGGCSVGIVGRTGSGKSSLLLSLFRLIDIDDGTIRIDGVDTSQIGIDVLRHQLAVIPQDPVLFGGTLRSNLDPSNEHSEARIWDALTKVCLDDVIRANGGLNAPIIEAGSNFSVGQRQVICLARALLADAKILALDEATANVDRGTDTFIQQSLRSLIQQSEKTLLIVAHRIDTVMNCDLLLVLDDGKLVETGRPGELMKKTRGLFAGMVLAAKKAHRTE